MTVDQVDTSASHIDAALTAERHRLGSTAVGMVLTLVIVTDERGHPDALQAANEAAKEHPCRILAVVSAPGKRPPRLDAEIHGVGESGPGELVLLRLHGPLSQHPGSVVLPLLLTDTPVVTWWPATAPRVPVDDQLGALAQRRVTDAAASDAPEAALTDRARGHRDGDTDLSWGRTTPWRSLLAAALDQPHDEILHGSVSAERANPSAALLAAWLSDRLGVEIERKTSRGPGITAARLQLRRGQIALTRPDGRLATLSRPAQPDRPVGLHRRSTAELLVEELRWLDADEVYGETVQRAGAELERGAGTGKRR